MIRCFFFLRVKDKKLAVNIECFLLVFLSYFNYKVLIIFKISGESEGADNG